MSPTSGIQSLESNLRNPIAESNLRNPITGTNLMNPITQVQPQESKRLSPISGIQSHESNLRNPITRVQPQESNPLSPTSGIQSHKSNLRNPIAESNLIIHTLEIQPQESPSIVQSHAPNQESRLHPKLRNLHLGNLLQQ